MPTNVRYSPGSSVTFIETTSHADLLSAANLMAKHQAGPGGHECACCGTEDGEKAVATSFRDERNDGWIGAVLYLVCRDCAKLSPGDMGDRAMARFYAVEAARGNA